MKLYKAEVIEAFDPFCNQGFLAKIKDHFDDFVHVNFTSPYANRGKGGLAGHGPEVGSKVIICELDNEKDQYYFIASIFDVLENTSEGDEVTEVTEKTSTEQKIKIGDPTRTGYPGEEIVLQNDKGCGLRLTDVQTKNVIDERSELYTFGKRVTVNNNPFINSILLDADVYNESETARLELVGDDPKNTTKGHHSFNLLTTGQHYYVSEEGILMQVTNGSEINIMNDSIGTNSMSAPALQFGNINLQSRYRDINLFGQGPTSQIRLQTTAATPAGGIYLDSKGGKVQIISGTAVEISAPSISLNALGNLSLKATGSLGLQAAKIDIKGTGPINMDGLPVYINSNKALPINIPVVPTPSIPYPLGVL